MAALRAAGLTGLAVCLSITLGAGHRSKGPTPQQPADRMAPIAWLAGCWELRTPRRVTLEMWMPPAAGLMLGAARTVIDGNLREHELTRLAMRGDTLVYTAVPSGQKETDFRGPPPADSGFVVENPAHDFPQRIIYRKRGADSLLARIEGPGSGGTTRGVDYAMRRVDCAR